MPKALDLSNQKFGRLTAISSTKKNGRRYWLCKCECGNQTEVVTTNLVRGITASCGCLHREQLIARNQTHGLSDTRLYSIYHKMKSRCYNERLSDFQYYGARGIVICNEWLNSFEAFREWAFENGYSDSLTIDRIDTDGNYEPSNCRWATMKVQSNNRRSNHIIEIDGVKRNIREWSKETGLSESTLYRRIKKGLTGKDLIKPSRKKQKETRIMSKTPSVLEFALSEGINLNETQRTVLALREKGLQTFVLIDPYQLDLINEVWDKYTKKFTLTAKPRLDR